MYKDTKEKRHSAIKAKDKFDMLSKNNYSDTINNRRMHDCSYYYDSSKKKNVEVDTTNKTVLEYINRFCKSHEVTIEEASEMEIVKEFCRNLKTDSNGKVGVR